MFPLLTSLLALSLFSTAHAATTVVLPSACVSTCEPLQSIYTAISAGVSETVALSALCSEPLYSEFVSCVNCVTANGSPTFLGYPAAQVVGDVDDLCLVAGETLSGGVTATQTASGPFTTITETGSGTVSAGTTTTTNAGNTPVTSVSVSAASGPGPQSTSSVSKASASAAAATSSNPLSSVLGAASKRIAVGRVTAGLAGVIVAALVGAMV